MKATPSKFQFANFIASLQENDFGDLSISTLCGEFCFVINFDGEVVFRLKAHGIHNLYEKYVELYEGTHATPVQNYFLQLSIDAMEEIKSQDKLDYYRLRETL